MNGRGVGGEGWCKSKEVMTLATKVGEIYWCEICGNKVEVKESGAGDLVCCGQVMTLVS